MIILPSLNVSAVSQHLMHRDWCSEWQGIILWENQNLIALSYDTGCFCVKEGRSNRSKSCDLWHGKGQTDLRWKESLSDHGQILHDRPVEWLASSVRVRSSGPRKQETVLAGPPSPLRWCDTVNKGKSPPKWRRPFTSPEGGLSLRLDISVLPLFIWLIAVSYLVPLNSNLWKCEICSSFHCKWSTASQMQGLSLHCQLQMAQHFDT